MNKSSSFLPPGLERSAAEKKAAAQILGEWTKTKLFSDPFITADEDDPFLRSDLVGSGSPEAKGGIVSVSFSGVTAPCGKCQIDCPGTYGQCLLLSADDGEMVDKQDIRERHPQSSR